MNRLHPFIINKSENEMDETYEYFRKRDIERAARELQDMETEALESEENLWGAPARERYNS